MENRVRNSRSPRAHSALDVVQFKRVCFNIRVGFNSLVLDTHTNTHAPTFLVN